MKLYYNKNSGNVYKVELLLSILKVAYERAPIDFTRNDHKQPWFLSRNPRGQLPVIESDDGIFWDSAACLAYVARKFGGEIWLPSEPAGLSTVLQWVALAGNEIQFGLQYARREIRRNGNGDLIRQYQATGTIALNTLENRLRTENWLALGRPTIADLACFPYVESAPEAGVSLDEFPAVSAWLERCQKIPGWIRR